MTSLVNEESRLAEQLKHETDESIKSKIIQRISQITSELQEIEVNNHKRDIPQQRLEQLLAHQAAFETNVQGSGLLGFVTSIGVDIASKEIQVGLNKNLVDTANIDFVVSEIDANMPDAAEWHVVYSEPPKLLSCNQMECTPVIGGNYIKIDGSDYKCSFGFQAKKGSTWGWITAGHCGDGLVGNAVKSKSGKNIGTLAAEKFYWGTYCDCAWVTSSSSVVDNRVFGHHPSIHTITKTTQASEQQNDTIMKSGQAGGIDFGIISAINVSVIDLESRQYHKGLVRSNTMMDHGDSGGPVVASNERGNLYGITATHDWWGNYHTPIDQITAHMGVTPVLN